MLNQIKESKYNDLLKNSMYVTNSEAIERHSEKKYDVNFNCITVPFSYINDSLVSGGENEINDYYKQNIEDYKQEEVKDVDYVVFNVVYSAEDELETQKSITSIVNDFKNLRDTDVDLFVRRNTDNTISNFKYQKESRFLMTLTLMNFLTNKASVVPIKILKIVSELQEYLTSNLDLIL